MGRPKEVLEGKEATASKVHPTRLLDLRATFPIKNSTTVLEMIISQTKGCHKEEELRQENIQPLWAIKGMMISHLWSTVEQEMWKSI